MSPMTTLTASAVLAAALASPPAQAQPNEPPNSGMGQQHEYIRERQALHAINGRIHAANERIERAARRGRLDGNEARRLRREVQEIRMTEERMSRDGRIDRREREALDRRLSALERHIRQELRD